MKKILSVLIALLMVFSLFACGNDSENTTSPEESSTPPSTAPESNPPEESQSPESNAPADPSENADEIGFFYALDPASRDTYNIVFAYPRPMTLMQNVTNVLEELAPKLNYNISTTTGDNDIDVYIQNLEVLATQGTDGFINVIDPTASDRIVEVLDEIGLPYIAFLNTVKDEDGHAIVPCVALDGYASGQMEIQWLYDNYKTYWGDIDTSKIGLIDITWSANTEFEDRYNGALNKFKELFPDNDKIFTADGITGGMDADTGFNITSPIFTANADVKYWFVASCLEMYAQGTARAAESIGIEDNVLVTDVGSDVLSAEWDNGYDGCWVSCVAISDYQYTVPTICGLISLIDGQSTPESLWAGKRADGDKYTIYNVAAEVVTKDTYQEYFDKIAAAIEAD